MTLIVSVLLLPVPISFPPIRQPADWMKYLRDLEEYKPSHALPRLPVQPLCTRRLRRRWERTGYRKHLQHRFTCQHFTCQQRLDILSKP